MTSVCSKLSRSALSLFKRIFNRKETGIMGELEFDVIFNEEDLFDETMQKQYVEGHDVTSPKEEPPKPECVVSKKGLAELTRKSLIRARKKKEQEARTNRTTPTKEFEEMVEALAVNIVEWCNYEAACGKWKYIHDMSKFDAIYFKSVCSRVRIKMPGVIIIPRSHLRTITIEWGSNQV